MIEYGEPWEARERTTDSPCSNASIFIQGDGAGEFDPPGTWVKVNCVTARETGLDAGVVADRIVACVNACAGVPTDRLHKIAGFVEHYRLLQARVVELEHSQYYKLKTRLQPDMPPPYDPGLTPNGPEGIAGQAGHVMPVNYVPPTGLGSQNP